MSIVYLINKREFYCSETDSYDCIVEAWTDPSIAEARCKALNEESKWAEHTIKEYPINVICK